MPTHRSLRACSATLLVTASMLVPATLRPQQGTAALALGLVLPAARTRPSLVVVPDVRGQTLSGAAVRVANVGLVPRHATSAPGNVDTSPVRRQWPRAGQRVPEGTVVALELASTAAALASGPAEPAAPPSLPLVRVVRASASAAAAADLTPRDDGGAWWTVAATVLALLAIALRRSQPARAAEPIPSAGAEAPPAQAGAGAAERTGAVLTEVRPGRASPPLVVMAGAVVSARATHA